MTMIHGESRRELRRLRRARRTKVGVTKVGVTKVGVAKVGVINDTAPLGFVRDSALDDASGVAADGDTIHVVSPRARAVDVDVTLGVTGGARQEDDPLPAGTAIGNYRIVRRLAGGGMSVVYEGVHRYLGRRVAIKVERARGRHGRALSRRFLGEAVSLERVAHAGIVRVLDYGRVRCPRSAARLAYLVMEYIEGTTLARHRVEARPMSMVEILDIGRQLAAILAAVHEHGVVHRDLKPDNIQVLVSGGAAQVKLIDFGVAKFAGDEVIESMHTNLRDVLGTPTYMSPEQCLGAADVDHRSDLYSLGCVLYELVCGEPPFRGTVGQVLHAHRSMAPVAPRRHSPDVPVALESLILQLLAKEAADRPSGMREVASALAGIAAAEADVEVDVDVAAADEPASEPAHIPASAQSHDHGRRVSRGIVAALLLMLLLL